MILRALYDYYNRCGRLPAFGMEMKQIGFLIVISKDGKFLRFEDRRLDKNTAQPFLVKKSVGRSSGVIPNTLYDNSQYVFGYMPEKGDMDKMRKYYDAFKAKIEEIHKAAPEDKDIQAVHAFYQQEPANIVDIMQKDSLWEDVVKTSTRSFPHFHSS